MSLSSNLALSYTRSTTATGSSVGPRWKISARIYEPLPRNAGRTGISRRPNSKRRGNKAERNSSIPTAKRTPKPWGNRTRIRGFVFAVSSSVLQDGEGIHCQLQVDYHVTLRLGATDQQIALGGRLERFGLVVYIARDQAAFASLADPRTARPAHRHVTGFREIEQARKLCVPAHTEAAAHKRHSWTRTHRALRRERRCLRTIDDTGRYAVAFAVDLPSHPGVWNDPVH